MNKQVRFEFPMGFNPGYPEDAYHADPGLGSGSIKLLAQSPAAYFNSRGFPIEGNDAMDFGSAFHMRVLEPERYRLEVVELDREISFATKEGKAFKEFHGADQIYLKPKQVRAMNEMLSGLQVIEKELGFDPFFVAGHSECAHFWDENGIRGKALIDRQVTQTKWLMDVKTTRVSLDERSIFRNAADYGWATQAAWYRRGVSKNLEGWEDALFVFAVFQSVPPFSVRLMPVPEETMAIGERLVERALANFAESHDARRPRDPNSGLLELKYPDWFVSELQL